MINKHIIILPCYYLPPVSWFSAVLRAEKAARAEGKRLVVMLEAEENFRKQTLRNRCEIDSPNGKLALSIPIDKGNFSDKGKCPLREVMISKQLDWRRQHWYALESSYYNSPFFEFLQDDFRPIYTREWQNLMELNEALLRVCLDILGIDVDVERTTEFCGVTDYEAARQGGAFNSTFNTLHSTFYDLHSALPYYQVFKEKHGFINDLSIVDLIFNMGNEARMYL